MPNSAVGLAGLELAKTHRSKRYKALIGLLVARREAAGMTQSDLAARLGKSQSFVSRLENGQRRITVVEFMTLAKILRFDPYKVISSLEKQTWPGRTKSGPTHCAPRDRLPLQGRLARLRHYEPSSAPAINSATTISPFSPTSKYLLEKPAVELVVDTHLTADMMKLN
jgi:transcriptional regulator with XRE-family HTH domain